MIARQTTLTINCSKRQNYTLVGDFMGEIPAFTIKCTFSANAFFKREILQVKKNLFAKMCANTQIIDVPFSAVLGIIRCEIGIA